MSPTFSGTVKSNDTSVSVASGTYTATSDVLTVNLNVASHSVIVGDIIKVSGITNVQVATGGSNVQFNGYVKVTAQTATTVTYQIATIIGTVGSTTITGTVSFKSGGLYLDSTPKVKNGSSYYPIQGATAWVNFDGTTTPPTIRDSFNVSAVIRTSTGVFDIYYKEQMDNVNYVLVGSTEQSAVTDNRGVVVSRYREISKATIHSLYDAGVHANYVMSTQIFGGKN